MNNIIKWNYKNSHRNLLQYMKVHKASYLFILPFSLVFFTFTVVSVLVAIYFSFTYYNILQPAQFIGWANYQKLLFADDIFLLAIRNTFIFAVITGPVSYFLCLMLAWFVNELSPLLRSFMTLLFYAPSLAGGLALWQYIFSSDRSGLLNSLLVSIGLIISPIEWLVSEATIKGCIIVVILWQSLGISFLSFIAGLKNVDRSLYEAGAVDGVKNRFQELWFITLPSMRGQLLFAAVMSITASFGIGDIVTQLAGFPSSGYSAHTIINHLQDYGSIRFDMGYACAIATLLFLIMVGANKFVQFLISRIGQ
jgi:multiple sugar transport system permease protein